MAVARFFDKAKLKRYFKGIYQGRTSILISRIKVVIALSLIWAFVIYSIRMNYFYNNEGVQIGIRIIATENECLRSPHADNKQVVLGQELNPGYINGFPKVIHRIFGFWDSNMKPEWRENFYHSCKEEDMGFIRILWNKTMVMDLLKKHYSWFIPTFLSYPEEVQRVDVARYFIIYHYGGLYLDMDIKCMKSPSLFFEGVTSNKQDIALVGTDPFGITNQVLLAKKCDKFLNYVLPRLQFDNKWYVVPYATIMFTTGPTYLSKKLNDFQGELKKNNNYSINVINPKDFWDQYFTRSKTTGTWHSWDAPLILFIYFNYKIICVVLLIILLMCLIFKVKMMYTNEIHTSG